MGLSRTATRWQRSVVILLDGLYLFYVFPGGVGSLAWNVSIQ